MAQPDAMDSSPLEVYICGDPILREKAVAIEHVTPEIRELARRMVITMQHEETRGIGLAAPQVGVGLRLVAIGTVEPPDTLPANPSPGEILLCPRMPLVLVNPRLVWFSPELSSYNEGCLSIPEIFGPVIRPQRVVLEATLLDGAPINMECGGLLARCLQHEVDHLDGILFVDRLDEQTARDWSSELRRLEKLATKSAKRRQKDASA